MFEKKRILFVHGRDRKPPAEDLHRLWLRALKVGLEDVPDGLRRAHLSSLNACCSSSYWATVVPFALPDSPVTVMEIEGCLNELIRERKELGPDRFHVGKAGIAGGALKSMLLTIGDALSQSLTIKDNVTKGLLADVRLYTEDQYIADRMRRSLEEGLRAAWANDEEVCLLTHSMGTGIAYDVMWRFSYRDEPEYHDYRGYRVKLFVTMGSPLGDPMYQSFLFAHHHKGEDRYFPTNIDHWCNFSTLGDIVCHDSTLGNDFHKEMRSRGLLKDAPSGNSDYVRLYNPYKDGKGKHNPHKSYGYLVQPKLAKWVLGFLRSAAPIV